MNNKIVVILAVSGILAFWIQPVNAQWARGKDKIYTSAAVGLATADQGFDARGNTGVLGEADIPEDFTDRALYLYLEYGLTDDLTIIASTFAKSMTVGSLIGSYSTTGLSDITTTLRYTIPIRGALKVSPEIGLKLPTGYDENAAPPLGSGKFDSRIGSSFGLSLDPVIPGYIGASFGFSFKGGPISNETYGHLEAGLRPIEKLFLRSRLDFINSTSNSGSENNSQLGLVLEQAYYTAGPGVTFILNEQIQINADLRWTVAGRTTAKLSSGIIGIAFTR